MWNISQKCIWSIIQSGKSQLNNMYRGNNKNSCVNVVGGVYSLT